MSEKNFYKQAQEALGAHLRQQQERREQQARADEEAAERLAHVMECKVRDGVEKGETHFEVLIQRHGGTTTAVQRAVERLHEMGFPRENISWTPETLRVSVDPPEGFGQQAEAAEPEPDGKERNGITNTSFEKRLPQDLKKEFFQLEESVVKAGRDKGRKPGTLVIWKISPYLTHFFAFDNENWQVFQVRVKLLLSRSPAYLKFHKRSNEVSLKVGTNTPPLMEI